MDRVLKENGIMIKIERANREGIGYAFGILLGHILDLEERIEQLEKETKE